MVFVEKVHFYSLLTYTGKEKSRWQTAVIQLAAIKHEPTRGGTIITYEKWSIIHHREEQNWFVENILSVKDFSPKFLHDVPLVFRM